MVEGDGRWICGGGGSFQTVVVVVSVVLEWTMVARAMGS